MFKYLPVEINTGPTDKAPVFAAIVVLDVITVLFNKITLLESAYKLVPVAPVAPFEPAVPVAPVTPVAPVGPVAPVAPCGPALVETLQVVPS